MGPGDEAGDARSWVIRRLAAQGVHLDDGEIELLLAAEVTLRGWQALLVRKEDRSIEPAISFRAQPPTTDE